MKKPTLDQSAATTGAVLAILGVFDVASRLGITGDDLAIVVGALGTLAGVIRHRFEARKDGPEPVEDEPTAELPATEDGEDA